MKTTLVSLLCLATALALPVQQATAPQCEYSVFEKFNLGHGHDVNTGSLLFGGTVLKGLPAILGSGCSPAWALGGSTSDNTPTKVPAGGAASFGAGAGGMPAGHNHGFR